MINFIPFQDHYITFHIREHNLIKDEIIQLIERENGKSVNESSDYIVTKQDYENSFNFEREYVQLLLPVIKNYIQRAFNEYMFLSNCTITNIWYHIYSKNDTYGWHIHDSVNWTGIYYLKLPKHAPKTDIKSLVKKNKVFTPKVKEGDVVLFPAHLHHRSKHLNTDEQKISIVFNLVNK